MLNKKGLSTVVATVLIVLLALAAIAVIWSFIGPSLTSTGGLITANQICLGIEVKPTSCSYNTTSNNSIINLRLERDDQNKAEEVLAIAEFSDGSAKTGNANRPSVFGTTPIVISNEAQPSLVRATATIQDPADATKTVTCPASATTITCATV